MSRSDIPKLLAMVSYSGQEMCPDEWEDAFDEYAELVIATSRVPGTDVQQMDGSTAGILDTGIFLGVGLAFLGQVALHVLQVIADLGVEKIAETGAERFMTWFRRGHGAAPSGSAKESEPAEIDLEALAERVTVAIMPTISDTVPQVTVEVVRVAVRLQVKGLASASGAAHVTDEHRGRR